MNEIKRTRFISLILFFVLTVSIFSAQASAVYDEDTFPYNQTGLTGGTYIECSSSLGDIVSCSRYNIQITTLLSQLTETSLMHHLPL